MINASVLGYSCYLGSFILFFWVFVFIGIVGFKIIWLNGVIVMLYRVVVCRFGG